MTEAKREHVSLSGSNRGMRGVRVRRAGVGRAPSWNLARVRLSSSLRSGAPWDGSAAAAAAPVVAASLLSRNLPSGFRAFSQAVVHLETWPRAPRTPRARLPPPSGRPRAPLSLPPSFDAAGDQRHQCVHGAEGEAARVVQQLQGACRTGSVSSLLVGAREYEYCIETRTRL